MNFLRLPDYLLSVLFEDDDIVAIDKPYGFNAHTNDSKIEHSEFIQDGLIEIYEKQLGRKLHIIHRLDQTTTGVMIFGKSTESAKKYAEFFFNREVKKTYLFLTKSSSSKDTFLIDQVIIHKARELDAKTQLTLLKKSSTHELWQANPFTGRNHQIRIHAQAAKIPILGDSKYEGAHFPFLCLHNHRIEFPNGLVLVSKPPIYFEDMSLLGDLTLARAFFEVDRRNRLFAAKADSDQCYRLVHTKNNSSDPGYSLDQFGKTLVLNWYKHHWEAAELRKFSIVANLLKKPLVVKFKQPLIILPEDSDKLDEHWVAKEDQVQFEMHSEATASVGQFLNQRLQRKWVAKNSNGKNILNLFSYTGGFSVCAALGGAQQVTSVDASKNALNWSRKNFEMNMLDTSKYTFLLRDSFSYLEQSVAKNIKYDLIICDTPSFMKRDKKPFRIKSDLETWLITCLSCLAPEGHLLFSTSFDEFFIQDIRKLVLQAQKKLKLRDLAITCLLPSLDFELPDEKTNLKSFLIKLA